MEGLRSWLGLGKVDGREEGKASKNYVEAQASPSWN